MNVTICGGGIIGASTAYHLALRGVRSTIIERCGLACGASGKAGGFLARDWCDHSEVGPLARKSFDMHMALAQDDRFKDCDYRKVDTLSVTVKEGSRKCAGDLPDWLDGCITGSSSLGTTSTTAQVHPYKLTHAFYETAHALAGTTCQDGIVEGLQMEGSKVVGVKTSTGVIPSDIVIITMGPWSGEAMKWFNLPPVTGGRAHSIVVKPNLQISAHACFMEYSDGSRHCDSPEAYPRPDGTVYICGMSDGERLPLDPKDVKFNPDSCKNLKSMAGSMSTALKDADTTTTQACYLPNPPGGLPLIGRIPNTEGVFLATGHSCWGILNAPATGEAIAQLVAEGTCSLLDLSPFDPAKL